MSLCQTIEHELFETLLACQKGMLRLLQLHVCVKDAVAKLREGDEPLAQHDFIEGGGSDELKLLLKAMQQEVDNLSLLGCTVTNVAEGLVLIHKTFQDEALCFYWDADLGSISHWRFAKEQGHQKKAFSDGELAHYFALEEI